MAQERQADGPWIPGRPARFEWPDKGCHDEDRLRREVQEGAKGLYVLYLPGNVAGARAKCLVEAYLPSDLRESTWHSLDPRQRSDWQDGRLIAIATVPLRCTFKDLGNQPGSVNYYMGELLDTAILELRRNNRNARSELKRSSSAHARKLEIQDDLAKREEKLVEESRFVDAYEDAYKESERHVRGNPFVSMHIGGDQ